MCWCVIHSETLEETRITRVIIIDADVSVCSPIEILKRSRLRFLFFLWGDSSLSTLSLHTWLGCGVR